VTAQKLRKMKDIQQAVRNNSNQILKMFFDHIPKNMCYNQK
jgi:hypothetical protein